MADHPQGDTPQETPRSSFMLDLSSGAAGKAKRPRGFVPVVQKTINLTTKKAEPAAQTPEPERPEPSRTSRPDARRDDQRRNEPRRDGPRRDDPRRSGPPDARQRDEPRPSGGTSLADLLDDATLARLRGE